MYDMKNSGNKMLCFLGPTYFLGTLSIWTWLTEKLYGKVDFFSDIVPAATLISENNFDD